MTGQELLDMIRHAESVRGTDRSAAMGTHMPDGWMGTLYHVPQSVEEYGSQFVTVHCPYFDGYTPQDDEPDYTSLQVSVYVLDYLIDGQWVLGRELEKERFPQA